MELRARALSGLPELRVGDDLAALIAAAAAEPISGQDVVAIAHKAVSKAEGATRTLSAVIPGEQAQQLGADLERDPRLVQVVLDESAEVLRAERGVLVTRTHHGLVCANAGVDQSNAGQPGEVTLLPRDPDASARALRGRLRELLGVAPAVVITDSFGRTWRHGQVDVAIGAAGLQTMEDWRGLTDTAGRELAATWIAVADQVAAAADLVRRKDSGEPVVLISGLGAHVTGEDGPGAASIRRAPEEDLFT